MKVGTLYFLAMLLISWAHVDGRNDFRIEDGGKYLLEYVNFKREPVDMDLMSKEEVPVLEQLPPEFICESCLAISRTVVEILNDPKLLETAGVISTKICQMLPSDRQEKCLDMSEMYVHQAILSLQKYFCEENLCNSTGLCTGSTKPILAMNSEQKNLLSWILKRLHILRFNDKAIYCSLRETEGDRKGNGFLLSIRYLLVLVYRDVAHIHAAAVSITITCRGSGTHCSRHLPCLYLHVRISHEQEAQLCLASQVAHDHAGSWMTVNNVIAARVAYPTSDEKSCDACHDVMEEILKDLQNPVTKIKVLRLLFKACENVKNHVKECQKLVFEYAPLVFANLEKFVANNDLCADLHICNATVPHAEEAANADASLILLPHAKDFSSEPTSMVM
ncbi:hypothetical protein ACLOJK_021835 [Asimina triloba]